ncbi:hypothetical protein RIF29_34798 [Crotalaria pallida]|uniref:Uncharacterized protein n=1 Tax=Crotalaria pallida TaxID=3830 RepID=A0AAN9EAG7_CROPI
MMWYLRHTRCWMSELGAGHGYVVDGLERMDFICSPEGHKDDLEASFEEMKIEISYALGAMNELDRIQTSIQEPPAASHVPEPTNVDDVVPMTSRERGGLGRRRRREEAVERRQQIAEDKQPGMYYVQQPYPYYTSQAPYETYFYPRLPDSAHGQPSPSQECYIPSPLPQGYMPSPQSYGYMPMPQMQGFNTPSPYDPVTSTPSAPGHWERELVSPNFDVYDMAGTSAPQFDLNTQLFYGSASEDANEEVRRNPHRGARDKHWRCGT